MMRQLHLYMTCLFLLGTRSVHSDDSATDPENYATWNRPPTYTRGWPPIPAVEGGTGTSPQPRIEDAAMTWYLGDKETLRWDADGLACDIILFLTMADDLHEASDISFKLKAGVTSYEWTVGPLEDLQLDEAAVYWFMLQKKDTKGNIINSVKSFPFKISESRSSSSIAAEVSSMTEEPSSSVTEESQSPSSDAQPQSTPSTAETGPASSTGLPIASIVGISVGATIGGLLMLAGLVWFGRKHWMRRQNDPPEGIITKETANTTTTERNDWRKSELEGSLVTETRGTVGKNAQQQLAPVSELDANTPDPAEIYEAP